MNSTLHPSQGGSDLTQTPSLWPWHGQELNNVQTDFWKRYRLKTLGDGSFLQTIQTPSISHMRRLEKKHPTTKRATPHFLCHKKEHAFKSCDPSVSVSS